MIIFDAGVIINLSLNNILWILPELKKNYDGDFLIPKAVEGEIITKPLSKKRFKLEAIQVYKQVSNKTLTITNNKSIISLIKKIDQIANSTYTSKGQPIKVVHEGEIEALALAIHHKGTLAIDERAMRELVENPRGLQQHLKRKLHRDVHIDRNKAKELKALAKNVKIIRSTELVTVAFELGLFDYLIEGDISKILKNPRMHLLDSLLWGTKLRGASITEKEIEYIEKHEL